MDEKGKFSRKPNVAKRRRIKSKDVQASPTLDVWLSKKIKPDIESNTENSNMRTKSSNENCDLNSVKYKSRKVRQSPANQRKCNSFLSRRARNCKALSSINQTKLDSFVTPKRSNIQRKFSRSESSDSCDLPIFKHTRSSNKMKKKSNSKYGNMLPSVEEILKDQKDLDEYRRQLETFQPLDDSTFELAFSIKDLDQNVENYVETLDCKQVSVKELNEIFKTNKNYLYEIMHGKINHARHNKFYNIKGRQLSLTTDDLTYNTTMIVFTYNQIEQLLTLLKNHFDPDDTKTQYFFQVLLPELCLQIFMKTHKMNRSAALRYLDKRPILPED